MRIHKIYLKSFLSKGYVVSSFADGELKMTTTFNTRFKRKDKEGKSIIGHKLCGNEMLVPAFIYLPEKYKLPLRIDMTVKIDTPSLHNYVGQWPYSFWKGQR